MIEGPYGALEARFRRLGALQESCAILGWDSSTMMPEGGAEARAEQLAVLKVVSHEILTDAALPELLAAAAGRNDLDPWQRANVREMERLWRHASAVPADLVEAYSKAASGCEMIWRKARASRDFSAVLPALERLLTLVRERATVKAEALGLTPYEALLDEYEPGAGAAEIDRLFGRLAAVLPGLIDRVIAHQARQPSPTPLAGPFPVAAQREAAIALMERLGFDFAHGRLDVSLHPFCGGTPDDVRITTRYDEADFGRALMGVLHETGHALYERGLPIGWRRQPVGAPRGMSLHESQSLLIEMQVCRSRDFLGFAAPILAKALAGRGSFDADNLYRLNTRVKRSFIRVDADEVTYPLHVILRYRLERAMIEGSLVPRDLPGAWNEGMARLLGVTPPDDALGCLQDIHWYDGAIGYFPTYTLGAMTAAQLFAAAKRADPAIVPGIASGDFTPLLAWLRTHIHGKASRFSTGEIIEQASGAPLDTTAYERHLEARYLS
ncbi:MAG TPA: carboxypeptidase M32 [Stellaceae bacterium]|nr:carboxypeptidase M32 [Stellaceae bacterium]